MKHFYITAFISILLLTSNCSGTDPETDNTSDQDGNTQDGILDVTSDLNKDLPEQDIIPPDGIAPSDVPELDKMTPDADAIGPDFVPEDVCVPDCGGKDCGGDGCNGSCGDCGEEAICSEAGTCDPLPCESTKNCPGDLICHKEVGICVGCITDVDCPENHICTAAFACYEVIPCLSDKDCKEMDMVCDKDQGFCVECITQVDCSLDQLCQDYICVTPFCLPEEPGCDSNSVVVCNATGTEWVSVQVCGENQYCVDAACQDQICEPGALFCEGPLLLTCNDMGSAIIDEVDCSDDGLYCSGGECVNCQPECTGKECGDDGCGGTCGSCPDNTPCVGGFCPNPCELAEYEGGSQGCEFWSLDLDNIEGGQYEKIGLVVAVPAGNGAAEIVIDGFKMGIPLPVSASELEVDNLSVAEGDYKIFTLPSGYDLDGSSVTSSSFRLTANVPVRAYQFNPLNSNSVFTSDASLLFPSHQAGNEYIALSWKQRVQGYKLRGNIAILAIHAGTTSVSVKVASVIKGNPPIPSASPGNTITLSLQQGQVINLETDGDQGSDLTGSIVSSDHPVMVYGAHECANIPLGTNYCDHIEQQLPAISKWGTHYIGDTFEPRSPNQTDIWRVISGADNVAIQFTPAVHGPTMLQKGDSVEFATGEHFELTATGPVEVGHYLTGSNHAGFTTYAGCSGGTGIGDPAFTIAIPVERHALSHQVLTPPDYELNYLNIMGPLEAQQGVSIDGEPISTPMTAIGETGLGVARIPVEAGFHVIESESIEIGVTAYGYACDVSYAYPGTWSGISQ